MARCCAEMGGPGGSRGRRPRSIGERQVWGDPVSEKSYRGGGLLPPSPWPHTQSHIRHLTWLLGFDLRLSRLAASSLPHSTTSSSPQAGFEPMLFAPRVVSHPHHVTSAFPREDWLSGLWTLAQHECGRPTPPLPCLKSLTSYSSFPLAGMAPVHLWQSWSGSPPPPRGVTGS